MWVSSSVFRLLLTDDKAKSMPPPPKAKAHARQKDYVPIPYETRTSPYFSAEAGNDVMESTLRPPDNDSPAQPSGKKTVLPSHKCKEQLDDTDRTGQSCQKDSSMISKKRLHTITEHLSGQVEKPSNSSARPQDFPPPPRTSYSPGSGFEDDEKLHDKVSKERRDFISAKTFGQSVKNRRIMNA